MPFILIFINLMFQKQMTMFKWIHMEANTYDIPIEEMVSGNSKVLGLHHGNRQFVSCLFLCFPLTTFKLWILELSLCLMTF